METLRGKFLLATEALEGSTFHRSVILVVRHDADGAMGLVVNRPLEVTVAVALGEAVPAAAECVDPVYAGGPCNGPVVVLHGDPGVGGDEPAEGVFMTTDRDEIITLLHGGSEPIKFFASYSGWSPGQLEQEIVDDSWAICPAGLPQVFSTDDRLWVRLTSRLRLGRFVDPRHIPEDPTVN